MPIDTVHAQGITQEGVYVEENSLFAGDLDAIERAVTILTGQNLTRGSVLGRVTASGKYVLSLSASADGSQTPRAILAHDVDATAADKGAVVYEAGTFDENKLILGTGHTVASIRDGLRGLGIHLRKNVKAV